MLHELGHVLKFFKEFQEKENPLDWQTYLKLMELWAPFVDSLAKGAMRR